jgi:hypothetical protein
MVGRRRAPDGMWDGVVLSAGKREESLWCNEFGSFILGIPRRPYGLLGMTF